MYMIDSLWKMSRYGCIPILMALAGRQILRRYPKEYSYYLWLLAFGRLLLPVFIEKPFGVCPLRYMGKAGDTDRTGVLAVLYLAGVCAVSGYFLAQYVRTRRQLLPAVREMKNIWRCENISSAFVAGLIRPRIVLPYGLEGTERWYVILHEKMHIRRGDPWMCILGTVTLCLHWWNPLVWYAVHKMYEDMEMSCDEAVMKECASAERIVYADILLKLSVEKNICSGVGFGESHTERRIRNLLDKKKKVPVWFLLLLYLVVNLCVRISFTVPKAVEERDCRTMDGDCRICYLLNLDGMKGLGHSALLLIDENGSGSVLSYNGMQYGLAECLAGRKGIGKMMVYSLEPQEVETLLRTGDLETDGHGECDNFDRMLYRWVSRIQYEQIMDAAKIYVDAGDRYEELYAAAARAEEAKRPEAEGRMEDYLRQDLPRYQIYTHNCDTVARELLALVDEEIRRYNVQEQKLTPKGNYKNMCACVSDQWGIVRLGRDTLVEQALDASECFTVLW